MFVLVFLKDAGVCAGGVVMPRRIEFKSGDFTVAENVEVVYESKVTRFGASAKVGAPKKFIGKRAYIVILKD
jgi:putative transposon-encoded protein